MSLIKKCAPIISSALLMYSEQETKAIILAHWNFDEGSGITAYDSSGNGNNGTLQGNVSWTRNSISGSALDFNGGQVRIVNSERNLDIGRPLTIEAYIKRESLSDGLVVGKYAGYTFGVMDNRLYAELNVHPGNEGAKIRGSTFLEEGKWYNLKITYDGLELKGYVNNNLEDFSIKSSSYFNIDRSQMRDVYLSGTEVLSHPLFYGIVDEVKIWNEIRGPEFSILNNNIPEPVNYGFFVGLGCLSFAIANKIKNIKRD